MPDKKEGFFVELDFPIVHVLETNYAEIPPISKNFNKASVVEINKTDKDDLFVRISFLLCCTSYLQYFLRLTQVNPGCISNLWKFQLVN